MSILFTLVTAISVYAVEPPSVARRILVCDQWQWIGGGAITWGCLSQPREALVAGGQITDEVIASLQDQINALKTQLQKNRVAPKASSLNK